MMKKILSVAFVFMCAIFAFVSCASRPTGKVSPVFGLRWEQDGKAIGRCHLMDNVSISGKVRGADFSDGSEIFLEVYYVNPNDKSVLHEITNLSTTIQNGAFKCDLELSSKDLENYSSGEYFVPEVSFKIKNAAGDVSVRTPVLKAYCWIKTQFRDRKTGKAIANRSYIIYKSDGSEIRGTTDENGYVNEQWLPFGSYYLDFIDE